MTTTTYKGERIIVHTYDDCDAFVSFAGSDDGFYVRTAEITGLATPPSAARVILSVSNHEGYSPDQIQGGLTLGEMLDAVREAIARFGPDAQIVTADGERYGANFGKITAFSGDELFVAAGEWNER